MHGTGTSESAGTDGKAHDLPVGGTADYYVMPKSEEEIRALISLCRREEVPYYIVGNGSNLLVSDAGYRGVIIAIGREMAVIEVHGCTIRHRPEL